MNQEILLLLIGAGIGFLSSILTTIINTKLKSIGKLRMYFKVVFRKEVSNTTWGFYKGNEGLYLQVPLWIEFHNTSNVAKIIRNFNLVLFRNGTRLIKMNQINKSGSDNSTIWYGNQGAYSFVIEPLSIKKFDLLFLLKQSEMKESYDFDEIRVSYFDGKGKERIKKLKKIDQAWSLGSFERDTDWQILK